MNAGGRLQVDGLDIADGARRLVGGVSLSLARGESLGLVGESGSGKSLTLRAIAGLLPAPLRIAAGAVDLDGVTRTAGARRHAGPGVGIVFQDPAAALNPLMRVGAQIAAVRRYVRGRSAAEARTDTLELLERVRLPDAAALAQRYPHELSGGQRQRIMIAFALAGNPRYLLCDEPTTALDVTVQAEILDLIDALRREERLGVLFVSHDLPVVARISERIAVMRHGEIVEAGPTTTVLAAPKHPYTRSLLSAARAVSAGRIEGGR